MDNVALPDFHDFFNAIGFVDPAIATVPSHVSFDVVWHGRGDRLKVRDTISTSAGRSSAATRRSRSRRRTTEPVSRTPPLPTASGPCRQASVTSRTGRSSCSCWWWSGALPHSTRCVPHTESYAPVRGGSTTGRRPSLGDVPWQRADLLHGAGQAVSPYPCLSRPGLTRLRDPQRGRRVQAAAYRRGETEAPSRGRVGASPLLLRLGHAERQDGLESLAQPGHRNRHLRHLLLFEA